MLACFLALWVLAAPAEAADLPAAPEADDPAEEEDLYQRFLVYRREHLEVRPVTRDLWVTPLVLGPDTVSDRSMNSYLGRDERMPRMAQVPEAEGSWAILRGAAERIDDDELARLLRDRGLEQQLADARFWPRVWWGSGFGAVSAATLGTGIWLTWFNAPHGSISRDSQAIGASLITVGVTSALVALLYPLLNTDHALSPHEAEARCNEYNERLRHNLELSPADLKRF